MWVSTQFNLFTISGTSSSVWARACDRSDPKPCALPYLQKNFLQWVRSLLKLICITCIRIVTLILVGRLHTIHDSFQIHSLDFHACIIHCKTRKHRTVRVLVLRLCVGIRSQWQCLHPLERLLLRLLLRQLQGLLD